MEPITDALFLLVVRLYHNFFGASCVSYATRRSSILCADRRWLQVVRPCWAMGIFVAGRHKKKRLL